MTFALPCIIDINNRQPTRCNNNGKLIIPDRTAAQFYLILCTGRSLTESDDTKCCINTIQPPDDEHLMLETC